MSLYEKLILRYPNQTSYQDPSAARAFYNWFVDDDFYIITELKTITLNPTSYQWSVYAGGRPSGVNSVLLNTVNLMAGQGDGYFGSALDYDDTDYTIIPGDEERIIWSGIIDNLKEGHKYFRFRVWYIKNNVESIFETDNQKFETYSGLALPPLGIPLADTATIYLTETINCDVLIHNNAGNAEIDYLELIYSYQQRLANFISPDIGNSVKITKRYEDIALGLMTDTHYLVDYPEQLESILSNVLTDKDYCYLKITAILHFKDTPLIEDYYDSNSVSYTIKLSNANPILHYEVVDTNPIGLSYTGDEKVLIRHISTPKVSVNHEGQKGATINSHWFIHNGTKYENYDIYTFDERVVDNKFEFYAKDNRGLTSKETYEAPFIPYVPLSVNFRSARPNGDGEVDIEVYGSYWDGNFGAMENELFVYFRYRKANETTFSPWNNITAGAKLNTANNTYSSIAHIKGLDYNSVYIFQGRAIDLYSSVETGDKTVGTKPIFDWSASDFNFNIPVNINGTLSINGERVASNGENKILWSGNDTMMANADCRLSDLVSNQASGIILVFSNASGDVSWSTHFVPKLMVQLNNGGGQTFMTPVNAEISYIGFKYLYIFDDHIEGHASNDAGGEGASGLWFNNQNFVLRYVIGV